MMYATVDAMIARYGRGEMIDLTAGPGADAPDEGVAGQALADASATIDGYLAARYAPPFPSAPALLEPLCCDIARYLLASSSSSTRATEAIRARRDDAIAWLRDAAAGKLGLGLDPSGAEAPTEDGASGAAFVPGRARVFDAGSLSDYTFGGGRR